MVLNRAIIYDQIGEGYRGRPAGPGRSCGVRLRRAPPEPRTHLEERWAELIGPAELDALRAFLQRLLTELRKT
jgi:hypothetical protein